MLEIRLPEQRTIVCVLWREPFPGNQAAGASVDVENHPLPAALSVENDSVSRRSDGQKDRALTTFALLASPFGLPTGMASFLPILLMIVVFYFLLIKPQQNRQKKWQQMLGSLKPGDKITTSGGIRGVILSIKDDAIQLRIPPDNLRIEVAKSAIASVTQDETK